MPLVKGGGKKAVSKNIRELHAGPQYSRTEKAHGKSTADKQAVAVAIKTARGVKAKQRKKDDRTVKIGAGLMSIMG